MSRPIVNTVRCICGELQRLTNQADCAFCRSTKRLNDARIKILLALCRGERPAITASMRRWLLRAQLIVPIGPPPTPSPRRRATAPRRAYALTPAGTKAVETIVGAAMLIRPTPDE